MNKHPLRSTCRPSFLPPKRDEESLRRRTSRMVLCLGDLPQSPVIERYFQERGWKVLLADTGSEARRLVRKHGATVALLAEEPATQESGWLTCWKLLNEAPNTRVIVVGSSHAERGSQRAEIVGATAYIRADEPASSIFRTLHASEGSVI